MLSDWNFWFTLITSIVAIIALFQTVHQTKLNNKQYLFNRRLDIFIILYGLIELCKEHYNQFLSYDENTDEIFFTNDLTFIWFTNNTYMEQQAKAIKNSLNEPFHSNFLKKQEELKHIAMEFQLIFKGKDADACSNFIIAYQSALASMYQYQIVINYMLEINAKSPMPIEQLQKLINEEEHRKKLCYSMNKLQSTYDLIQNNNSITNIKHQIKLIKGRRAIWNSYLQNLVTKTQ